MARLSEGAFAQRRHLKQWAITTHAADDHRQARSRISGSRRSLTDLISHVRWS